ncbi:MAG: hypothetical protein WBQ18_11775, partial [Solirubrobacteraceae bacterium]
MRSAEDPRIDEALRALDATLAGEPADPEYADLAELAILLRDERPVCDSPFAARLDERVRRGFAPPPTERDRRWWRSFGAWGAA